MQDDMNVKLFFETFLENVNEMSSEEFEYYSHKIKFVFDICNETINNIRPKNMTSVQTVNGLNLHCRNMWKSEYESFKWCSLNYVSIYFGLNTFTNQIFKLIKFAILDDSYFVTKECFNNPFDYENHKDMIYVSSGIDSLRHRIKDNICHYSLTNLSIKLCKLFANNYSKYVTEKHIYSNLSQELNNALTKHNMNYGNIQFCKMAPTKENLQERTYLYWFSCLNIMNESSYACYCDVYNVMKKYCDLIESDIKLHNSITGNINIQAKQSTNDEFENDINDKTEIKSSKFKEMQNLGANIKKEIPELYCGPVMSSVVSLLMKEYGNVDNILKKVTSDKDSIIKLFNECSDKQKNKSKTTKSEQKVELLNSDKDNKKVLKNKKTPIPKKIKQLVWNKYIGEEHGTALCKCCEVTVISQMDFVCGHIISEYNGGTVTIDNLKPICSLCNSSMGTKNIDEFITMHGLNGNLSDDSGVKPKKLTNKTVTK